MSAAENHHDRFDGPSTITRRRLLRDALVWSAASALPAATFASSIKHTNDVVHVLMVGDWGAYDPSSGSDREDSNYIAQAQVARGMQKYAQMHHIQPEALFFLGDNWYDGLPDGAKSQRWVTQFEKMYPSSVFPGPAYALLGNHDYQFIPSSVNKVEAELEYARIGRAEDGNQTRWTLPARWYTFDLPAHKPLMRCIVLDSNMPFADGTSRHGQNFTLTPQQRDEQLQWFEAELKKPRTTPFLTVMAHHPIYSNGPHGDQQALIRDWDPLLRKYNVDLYLAGHDHDLQVLQFQDHPTIHFLSGGGGASLYTLKIDDLQRGPYAQEVHGFSHLSVTKDELQLRHLDQSGRFLYGVAKRANGTTHAISV